MTSIKVQLRQLCAIYLTERIAAIREVIKSAQDSSNEETKSSAGDKYETGRAMAQLEIEKNRTQLDEFLKQKQRLETPGGDPGGPAKSGNLVLTDQGNFYLAIPAGPFLVDGKSYFAISVDSPIGVKLLGSLEGSFILFRDKRYHIDKIL